MSGQILVLLILLFLAIPGIFFGQNPGILNGRVIDSDDGSGIAGATITITGTYLGAISDESGNFTITGIKPGDYSIRCESFGSVIKEINGILIKGDSPTVIEIKMIPAAMNIGPVIIEGDAAIVNLENGQSSTSISGDAMAQTSARSVEDIVKMQASVTTTPDGIVIRGGRVYETKQLIEDFNSGDPLAGTGSGVTVSSASVAEIEIVTGGGDAEFGNGTSGIINTKLREGGDKLSVSGKYFRDNFGNDPNRGMSWNTDEMNLNFGGPLPFTGQKVRWFASLDVRLTDEYFNIRADQLHSSLFPGNDSVLSPRQGNHYSNTFTFSWNPVPGLKISAGNQNSLNINQNTRSLQVVGNDAILTPGFQFPFSLDPDQGNTFTHLSNLSFLKVKGLIKETWTIDAGAGRLFVNLRADANGRPFRYETVDRFFDPASIVTDPVLVSDPSDSVVYVYPGPGLYNNGGIATKWHDHFARELTIRVRVSRNSKNKIHHYSFGQEHKEQYYQWVDVSRPWVGAPIRINDTTFTPSVSVGSSSDVWAAKPANGGFFFSDEIRYKGIIANLGARLEYWAPGKFADRAVADSSAPVTTQTREDYLKESIPILGRRFKARFLPKLRVSFPVTENNVLYFNYGHSTLLPHPRFVYAGLDPVYQDRSFLANLGNPNLNPEVTVAYEVGWKSRITADFGFTLTAYYNDKFDYIVSRQIIIADQTGRLTEKTFFINQDYARVRGVELTFNKRIGRFLAASLSGNYQIATGKSNSAAESALQIKQFGFVTTSKEQFLAWDRPFDAKFQLTFTPDTIPILGMRMKGWRAFISATYKSGLRYTPCEFTGTNDLGRPLYESISNRPYSEIGSSWFWADIRVSRDFHFGEGRFVSLSLEFQNVFNNKNSQIINGVTGTAYRDGDAVPIEWRDPSYPDPQDNGLPPTNPARYMQPRHMFAGVLFRF